MGERRSWLLSGGLAFIALAVAVAASLATGPNLSTLTGGVERLSAASTSLLGRLGDLLPLGYAFGAGMVAAVNPCGFAMLPAYIGLFLGSGDGHVGAGYMDRRLYQALLVSLTVTFGFVLLFGAVGLLISAGARVLIGIFPWIGLLIGLLLILVGAWVFGGGGLHTGVGDQLAARVGYTRQKSVKGYFLFGLSYGLASLSCTLPVFLVVVGTTVAVSGLAGAFLQFILYGLGMGWVLFLLTTSMALFEGAMVRYVRNALPYLQPVSALLLVLAGTFIVYYWLTLGGLLGAWV
ncbi:MAG: hypothetical protein KatS3mg050_1465 [Litorilinea sp.]|nr:MAG: hypothetical protein KatS3mg050_1465 [Litorilinea sp.]